MIQIVTADGVQEKALIADLRSRSAAVGEEITRSAAAIMEDVRWRGYEAVEEYSLKFDKAAPRRHCGRSVLCADERRARQGGRSGGDHYGHASHCKPQ